MAKKVSKKLKKRSLIKEFRSVMGMEYEIDLSLLLRDVDLEIIILFLGSTSG